ncbi:MAG: hypothetical protein WD045_02845 [Pirellulaceae bacterium]
MSEYPIRKVERSQAKAFEPIGSKPKFWFREGPRELLFKADDRGTGEDWAEKITCELCRLLGLPHVEYELATEVRDGSDFLPGVVCENMSPRPTNLALGNELLFEIDPGYPREKRFKVRQHTVDNVLEIVTTLDPPEAPWMRHVPTEINSALDVFVGYVLLDAWVANQDRHHENWAAIRDGDVLRLAPTFDHGAALARNLLDSEREERLATKDRNRTMAAFVRKGRSAFYGSREAKRPLELKSAWQAFASHASGAAKAWLDRLRAIEADQTAEIIDQVPASRMSAISKSFTIKLLEANQQRLLERNEAA